MTKALSAVACRNARPGPHRRELADAGCPGLYLVVQISGVKSWAVRYRRPGDGRNAKLTLGRYAEDETPGEPVVGGPLTLAAARALAATVRRQLAQGSDPVDARAQQRRAVQQAAENTFAAAARRFVLEHARPKTRRWQDTARTLGLDPADADLPMLPGGLAERWQRTPATHVTKRDVLTLVDEVRRRGVPGLKKRRSGPCDTRGITMHAALSAMFGWLVERDVVSANPCQNAHRPAAPPARERRLTDGEMRAMWRGCDDVGLPFGPLFKFLLLTGCRRNEAARMRRAELSADLATWTLPADRAKNGREHTLPLPPLARQLLTDLPQIDACEYVFSTNGRSPVSGFSKIKRRLDASMGNAPAWRLHDLRRTAASGMARAGVDLHVIERVLNHVSGSFSGIVGVYQRHKFEPEMRAALEAWERLLLSIVEPGAAGNVVPMRREMA